jgi:uncharacterized RDD family membrane protein YckC
MTSLGGSQIECPKCGRENDKRTRFCNDCGLVIDGRCPNCSRQNAAGSHFCSSCAFDFVERQVTKQETPVGDLRTQGAPQPGTTCPRCHHVNEQAAPFCSNCGLPFGGEAGFRPAALGFRVGGLLIDALVITAIYALLAPGIINETLGDAFSDMKDSSQSSSSFLLDSVVSWAYGTALLTLWATTVGKRVFRVSVVRFDGTPIGPARAAAREFIKVVSFASLLLAAVTVVMIAVRADRRGLHDVIAGTVVVKR